MADFKIGANLYADTAGRYFSVNNGARAYQESPFEGTQKKITELYDAQKKNQLAALQQQRTKAVAGFNQQKKDLAPQYQNQRNQADVVNAQNVARLRELMAANGVNASGENLTTQAQMASSRQSALGEINNNEQTAMRAIDQQIAGANDISKDQAITNDIEAKRSEAMLNAYQNWLQDVYQKEKEWKALEEQQAAAARAAASRRSTGGSRRRRSTSSKGTPTALPNTPEAQRLENTYQLYQNILNNSKQGKTSTRIYKGPTPLASW